MCATTGHPVITADSYGAALREIDRMNVPVVAVIDHNLDDPKADNVGYAVCRYLRTRHPFGLLLPIIYNSGKQSDQEYLEAIRDANGLGPSMFVAKGTALSDHLMDKLLEVIDQFEELWATALKQAGALAMHNMSHGEGIEL